MEGRGGTSHPATQSQRKAGPSSVCQHTESVFICIQVLLRLEYGCQIIAEKFF